MISCTLKTTASPERIWATWTDVGSWPQWDSELISAQLQDEFELGATGRLTPKTGPASTFVISQLSPGESYTFTTCLPLCKLYVRRYFSNLNAGTEEELRFTHEVVFEGLLSPVFRVLLGRRFQRVLPDVMAALRAIAQS